MVYFPSLYQTQYFIIPAILWLADLQSIYYFDYHRDKDIVTYDVVESNNSCFYGRQKP
jgi:hypothetical protein